MSLFSAMSEKTIEGATLGPFFSICYTGTLWPANGYEKIPFQFILIYFGGQILMLGLAVAILAVWR